MVLLLTPFLIRWATEGNLLDQPDYFRKRHDRAVPRIGGLPLYVVFLMGLGALFFLKQDLDDGWLAIAVSSTLIFAVGLWDDFKTLGAKKKLAAQVLAALVAFGMGLKIDQITYPVGHFSMALGIWSIVLTILWLVTVPNLINLIDGVDGVASGLGLFLFLTLGFVGWSAGQLEVTWICFALAGALLGFLCFNFPPAKIFLGDGGAYLIGFAVAAISLQSANKGAVIAALLVTIVALGLPIMDTTLAILRRAVRGFPLFRADAEHIHHRLGHLGLSKRRVVLAMYLVSAALSFVGLSVLWTQGRTLPIAGAVIFVMGLIGVRYLGYIWSWAELREQFSRAMLRRPEVQYTILQAKVLELEVERCGSWEDFLECLNTTLRRVGFGLREDDLKTAQQEILLKLGERHSLMLWAPVDDTEHHWRRLAECFREPYLKAMEKWKKADVDSA
ncbi:MAG: undecaprenyl/decaprenyl-phosphate alpha-N-acetylglucosaminyl 1-phosphate transferase [Blastochloris sp.]|nr:undecaprenyl/decaprenyl-phosphate alpha-N-acetylglucosaminyl 1-phosphate transferase [Blastochloris sp.]